MANYIGNSPENIIRSKQDAFKFVATASQTAFTGNDANGNPMEFAPTDFISVFLNGVRLIETDDYTVGNDTITLGVGATVNDELIITTIAQVLTIDTYSKVETDALLATKATTADLATKATTADIDSAITSDNVNDDGNALLNALIFGG